jgi:hypothetical protein
MEAIEEVETIALLITPSFRKTERDVWSQQAPSEKNEIAVAAVRLFI